MRVEADGPSAVEDGELVVPFRGVRLLISTDQVLFLNRHFPYDRTARDHRGPFSFIDQHFIRSDTAIKPVGDFKIGFPTPAEMPSALDGVPLLFSTKR